MITSIDTKKVFDKIPLLQVIKTLSTLGIKGLYLNMTNQFLKTNSIQNSKW